MFGEVTVDGTQKMSNEYILSWKMRTENLDGGLPHVQLYQRRYVDTNDKSRSKLQDGSLG